MSVILSKTTQALIMDKKAKSKVKSYTLTFIFQYCALTKQLYFYGVEYWEG